MDNRVVQVELDVEELHSRVSQLEKMLQDLAKWTGFKEGSGVLAGDGELPNSNLAQVEHDSSLCRKYGEFEEFGVPVTHVDVTNPLELDETIDVTYKIEVGAEEELQFEDEFNLIKGGVDHSGGNVEPKTIYSKKDPDRKFAGSLEQDWTHCCYFCSKKFSCPAFLNRHLASHTNEALFKCPTCKKEFTQNGDLKRHSKIHGADGGRKFPCSQCPLKFTQNGHRNSHEKNIHFMNHKELDLATYTKKTHFICRTCKKYFTQKSQLNRHEKIHGVDGGRKFPCSFCPLKFTRKTSRIRHEKSIHLKIQSDSNSLKISSHKK